MLKCLRFSQNLVIQSRKIGKCTEVKLGPFSTTLRSNFCSRSESKTGENSNSENVSDRVKSNPVVASKYELFTEENATVILDIEEERDKMLANELEGEVVHEVERDIYDGLNIERGTTGVFEIDDLMQVLRRDNAQDIFVCSVPAELKYVDYMVVITARSHRHMKAIAEFVRKMYKIKRFESDLIPKIEGKHSDQWIAMDMGNIALHIFSAETRKKYDLEMLWSVGAQYDTEANKPEDPMVQLFERHSTYLNREPPKSTDIEMNSTKHIDVEKT